jgi:glycine/D-amino acid oxidase-like deaminating enzyme
MNLTRTNDFDVVVIGGGAAGLSAAPALTRHGEPWLVVDAGAPEGAPGHDFLRSSRDLGRSFRFPHPEQQAARQRCRLDSLTTYGYLDSRTLRRKVLESDRAQRR